MFEDNSHGDRFSRMGHITPEEFKKISDEYAVKSEAKNELIRKTLIGIAIFLGVSFIAVNLTALFNQSRNYGEGIGTYYWLLFQVFILPMVLFDPKQEQKFVYEQDYAVLLRNCDRKLKLDITRFYVTIALGVIFTLVNAGAWYVCIFNLIHSVAA